MTRMEQVDLSLKFHGAFREKHDSIEHTTMRKSENIVFYGREFLNECSGKDLRELVKFAAQYGKHPMVDLEVICIMFDRVKKLEEIIRSSYEVKPVFQE